MIYQNCEDVGKALSKGKFQVMHMLNLIKLHSLNMCSVLNKTAKKYSEHSKVLCFLNQQFHISSFPTHSTPFKGVRKVCLHGVGIHPWNIFKIRYLFSFTRNVGGSEGLRKQESRYLRNTNLESRWRAVSHGHFHVLFYATWVPPYLKLLWSSQSQSVFLCQIMHCSKKLLELPHGF